PVDLGQGATARRRRDRGNPGDPRRRIVPLAEPARESDAEEPRVAGHLAADARVRAALSARKPLDRRHVAAGRVPADTGPRGQPRAGGPGGRALPRTGPASGNPVARAMAEDKGPAPARAARLHRRDDRRDDAGPLSAPRPARHRQTPPNPRAAWSRWKWSACAAL